MNRKLSRMIDMKGFSKLLNKIREGKKTWKDRPDSSKIQTLDREIQNAKKQKEILRTDLEKWTDKKAYYSSSGHLNDLNQNIAD